MGEKPRLAGQQARQEQGQENNAIAGTLTSAYNPARAGR
jgi:hypothetical protein